MKVIHFDDEAALDRWFRANHAKADELFVGFWRKETGKGGIAYKAAVDAALAWGWIDGVRRKLDDEAYTNRFTPRRATSNWSAINLARYAELDAAGKIRPPGRKAFESRDPKRVNQYSFENRDTAFDAAAERAWAKQKKARAFFDAQPPGYRRLATFWVMSAKREDTRASRLEKVIAASVDGVRAPEVVGKPK